MAYSKKVSRRYSRRSYRRYPKYSRRRRYRKYRSRRRRHYKKPEYKRIEHLMRATWRMWGARENTGTQQAPVLTDMLHVPWLYSYTIIGTGTNANARRVGIDIEQGVGVNQRIGAKIDPCKLKCYVSLSMVPMTTVENDQQTGLLVSPVLGTTESYSVRFIVLQVRNGRGTTTPMDEFFTNVNPYGYNYAEPGWFTKMFVQGPINDGNLSIRYNENDQSYDFGFKDTNLAGMHSMMRAPYRRGTGGQFKILKDKVFYVNTTNNYVAFKFKTKKPERMTWVETRGEANTVYTHPKNPIYIIAIPCAAGSNYHSYFHFTFRFEFTYTDM